MKYLKTFLFTFFALMGLQATAVGQTNEKLANLTAGGSSVRLDVLVTNSGSTLIISAPDGRTFRRDYKAGVTPEFSIIDQAGERLPDGVYTYELRLNSAGDMGKLRALRARDDDSEVERTSRKRPSLPNLIQSGSFAIVNGGVVVAGALEESRRIAATVSPQRVKQMTMAKTLARLSNHRTAALPFFDFVIADDLIVQGSACVGLDCVDGENFGFDTIRTKENNVRIQFDDTSTSVGFPTENWQIRANSSASGGGNFLGIVDQGTTGNSETGTIVFEVDAGAPANSIRVASNGKVGFRTATPVLDLHINGLDTPAVRFEQNGGFGSWTWDVAGNEANFFVRDVTSGSRLPFRIRPGAPTSSIDISASGNVGVGTGSPTTSTGGRVVHIDNASGAAALRLGDGAANGQQWEWQSTVIGATGAMNLSNITAVSNPMTILATGNVGIGTTAPTQLLSVNGTAGKPGGGSWDIFSDERLKNIKGRFNLGLKAVMQLQPLRYQYRRDNPIGITLESEQIGFGAQSLRKVIPEAVTQNANGYLMVNNDPILWTMLNAIKEQQKQIVELKAQVQKLQRASHRRRR
jgi:hypothetical protein